MAYGDQEPATVLSVRGESRRSVPPDLAELTCSLRVLRDSKTQALRDVASALEQLTAELAGAGGTALTPDTTRATLTWSARSVSTEPEHALDRPTQEYRATGRFAASVGLRLVLRELDRLGALDALLARHPAVQVHFVRWDVDRDNPAWPELRAGAVRAALRKGADYAAALGVPLRSVEHVADVGLLAGVGVEQAGRGAGLPTFQSAFVEEGAAAPSLDPVPQELVAVVEARLLTERVRLPPGS